MISLRARTPVAALLAAAVVSLLARSGAALARPSTLACLTTVNGPCQTAEPFRYLPPSEAHPGVVLTNFGLLYPGARPDAWEVSCDDNFGFAPPDRVRRAPDGRIFTPSNQGLYYSADGCTWTMAAGELAGQLIFDVGFDTLPTHVWALGNVPRKLYLSQDGGKTFAVHRIFEDAQTFQNLAVAPSDSRYIYLFGRGRLTETPLGISTDEGKSFTFSDLAKGASPVPRTSFDFIAVSPEDPLRFYLQVINPAGDELWHTTDGGKTVSRILELKDGEAFGGLTFGTSPGVLYAAGYSPFPLAGMNRGTLHVSRDHGQTWEAGLPAGPEGPTFRCLAHAGGKLYACAAGEPAGDPFMVGVSEDDGHTWKPEMRFKQVAGMKSCVRALCITTEEWLCNTYTQCPAGVSPPGADAAAAPPDAAAAPDACAGPRCTANEGGCSCAIGGTHDRGPGPWPLAVAVFALAVRLRRRRVCMRPRN